MPQHRGHPPRGADAPAPRHRGCRVEDQDPRQVPARARERGVRDAARARRSSRRSCAPTPRRSGSIRRCWSRSTAPTYESRDEVEHLQPLGPTAVARDRRRGAARPAARPLGGDRPGRGASWSASLLVIGLVGGDDEGGGGGSASGDEPRPRRTETHARQRPEQPRAAEAGGAAHRARQPDLRLRRHGAGHRRDRSRASSTRRRPSAGAGCASTSARRDVQVTKNGKRRADRAGPRPGRLRVHPAVDQAAAARRASLRLMAARAGIVVTGTEVLTGRVRDRNGPWLSDRLLELGVELAHITICGDRPEDMTAQLALHGRPGRGPGDHERRARPDRGRPDDRDGRRVHAGAPLFLDEDLEERIADILRPLMKRFRHLDFDAVRAANRKQALVPEGAHVIYPAGTAPGLVVPGKPTIVVLPGPPRELHAMWPQAVETEAFQEAIGGRTDVRAADAAPVRHPGVGDRRDAAGGRGVGRGLRRARDHHLPAPRRGGGGHALGAGCAAGLGRGARPDRRAPRALAVLRRTARRVDDQVAALLAGRWAAVAESCTGGPDGGAADRAAGLVGRTSRAGW